MASTPRIGSYAVECRNDDVLALALRLFASLPFRGLGYVEMKHEVESGRYLLIEANIGRPTGRSAMAEAGGVELLYTMYSDAAGLPLPTQRVQTYRGASWIDLRRDVLSAVYHWRRGELTAAEWLRSLRGPTVHAVLSARDPLPFAFDVGQSSRRAVGRFVARLRARCRRRSPAR